MNNKEFLTELANRLSLTPAQCQKTVYEFADALVDALETDNDVTISGLGTFEVKSKKERIMINPSNGKKMLVPPKLAINFKMSNSIKSKIN